MLLEDAQQIKQVLVALSRLAASNGQPFILAFDQVDNLDNEQFAALSRFLESAAPDIAPNLLVVTAGVRASLERWRELGVVQHSAWDRLGQFEIALQRLNLDQARQLLHVRLDNFLAPFTGLEAVQQRRHEDALFPLGNGWFQARTAAFPTCDRAMSSTGRGRAGASSRSSYGNSAASNGSAAGRRLRRPYRYR